MKSAGAKAKIEFGDFQTPADLAREVCEVLLRRGVSPSRVIEPTCGVGAFLQASSHAFPATELAGFEINPDYAATARTVAPNAVVTVADFFSHDWDAELLHDADPLLLGNPPWVTNAAISVVEGGNLPVKENIYGLRGLAAKTGKANFDIAEWIILRLLRSRRGRPATLAVLCKTSTARKVLRHAWRGHLPVEMSSLHLIDAAAKFGAAVDACLFVARIGSAGPAQADVFASLDASKPSHRIGLAGADMVADLDEYRRLCRFEGLFPFQWRSGVKHDCASVLELSTAANGSLVNKAGQVVEVESIALFPWCKSTGLARRDGESSQWLLLPQGALGESTETRFAHAPRALAYLEANRAAFTARKSSIYKRGGPFAIFGVGDYTFAPWKVAVSALHRPIRFVVVGPKAGQPVLFDDTCYYLSFAQEREARAVAEVLSSPLCIEFLDTLIFPGAKRAVTVELLQRLDFRALAAAAGVDLSQMPTTNPTTDSQYELLSFGT